MESYSNDVVSFADLFKDANRTRNETDLSSSSSKTTLEQKFDDEHDDDIKQIDDDWLELPHSESELGSPEILKVNKLKYYHSLLITITNTLCSLIVKLLIVFIPFILREFEYSYTTLTIALGIGSLLSVFLCLMDRILLNLKSNLLCFMLCIMECIGLFFLWFFAGNRAYNGNVRKCMIIIGIFVVVSVEKIIRRCCEHIIFALTTNQSLLQKLYVSLNLSWALAAFLFIPSGFVWTYLTLGVYLEILFAIFMFLAICNLMIIPKLSVNKYISENLNDRSMKHLLITESLGTDLKILWDLKQYRYIVIILILISIAGSYFYITFGIWLESLYSWQVSQFAVNVGLIEGISNVIAIIIIVYFVKRKGRYQYKHQHKLSSSAMMICFGFLLSVSIIAIWTINYVFYFKNVLLICIMIALFFCGLQGMFMTLMIVNMYNVRVIQKRRSSIILCIVQSISIFIGQCSIGLIYDPLSSINGMMVISSINGNVFIIHIIVNMYE